jgi:hypothetical protein
VKSRFEVPKLPRRPMEMTPELRDFLRRRTMPFLDSVGVERPLNLLLEEAYLQGMKDAIQAFGVKSRFTML